MFKRNAIKMGIFDMFTSAGGASGGAAAPTNSTPANGVGNPMQVATTNSADTNPLVPNQSNSPVLMTDGVAEKSPLDNYSKIWDTNTIKPVEPLFNVDPNKMMEAASAIDFSSVITPDLQARINAGGDDANKANMEVMNKIAQTVYAQSAVTTTKLVEQAVNKAREQFTASIPDIIKGQTTSDLLRNENPVFNNPAISPVLKSLESQIRIKNPTLNAQEIASMAKDYFLDMSSTVQTALNPPKDTDLSGKKIRPPTDWSQYL